MYRRILLLLVFCLIFSVFTSNAAAPDSGDSTGKVFMWKVSPGNNSSDFGTAFILGAPDIGLENIFPLDKKIQDAYAECRKVIVNLDPAKVKDRDIEASLLAYGLLDKTTLDKVIPADTYKRADTLVKKFTGSKKSLKSYTRFKPWVIENLIINLSQNFSKEYPPSTLSTYFIGLAQNDKKGVFRLESVDYQYRLLGSLSYSVQNVLLEKTIKALEAEKNTEDKITKAWKGSDTQSLTKLLIPDFGNNTALSSSYNYMLLDRNKHTAEYLKTFLRVGGKYFYVADAAQLLGENSVLKLLEDMGFKLEQM